MHLDLRSIGVAANLDGQGKLGGEHRQRAKLAGEDIVKQGPQLSQPVLDGGATHDDSVHCLKLLGCESDFRIWIPDFVALIKDGIAPCHVQEQVPLESQLVIASDQDAGRTVSD